jgi:hypothetical protein
LTLYWSTFSLGATTPLPSCASCGVLNIARV